MDNLKFGVRAHDLGAHSLSNLFDTLSQASVKYVQLAPSKLSFWDIQNKPITDDFASLVNKEFTKHNIEIPILGCYTNIVDPNDSFREANLQRFENYLKFSKKIQHSIVATETDSVNPGGYSVSNFSETTFKKTIESINRLVETAEKEDVVFAIEPGINHPIDSIDKTQRLLDWVSSSKLKLIFDPVNLISGTNYLKQEEIISFFLENFQKQIVAVHLKDFKSSGHHITTVGFGQGELNHPYLVKQILKYIPDVFCSFEGITPTEFQTTIDFFKDLLITWVTN